MHKDDFLIVSICYALLGALFIVTSPFWILVLAGKAGEWLYRLTLEIPR